MQDSLQTFKNLTVMFYLDDWSVLLLYTAKLEMNHSFTILCFKAQHREFKKLEVKILYLVKNFVWVMKCHRVFLNAPC